MTQQRRHTLLHPVEPQKGDPRAKQLHDNHGIAGKKPGQRPRAMLLTWMQNVNSRRFERHWRKNAG
eukprot:8383980-Ditylum_brightwellii.AAC.1